MEDENVLLRYVDEATVGYDFRLLGLGFPGAKAYPEHSLKVEGEQAFYELKVGTDRLYRSYDGRVILILPKNVELVLSVSTENGWIKPFEPTPRE